MSLRNRTKCLRKWAVRTVGLTLLLMSPVAAGARYWVSQNGTGTSVCSEASGADDPGRYLRTPKEGVACLTVSGDRLTIKAGQYSGPGADLSSSRLPGGTAAEPLIIEGEGDEGCAVMQTCQTELRVSAGISIASVRRLVLRKLEFDCSAMNGIQTCLNLGPDSNSVDLEDVEIHDAPAIALRVERSGLGHRMARCNVHHNGLRRPDMAGYPAVGIGAPGAIVEESEICDNGDEKSTVGGLQLYRSGADASVEDVEVRRNLLCRNGSVMLFADGADVRIHHNLIVDAPRTGVQVGGRCSSGTVVSHNTVTGVYAVVIGSVTCSGRPLIVVQNNLLRGDVAITNPDSGWVVDGRSNALGNADVSECTVSTVDQRLRRDAGCIDRGLAGRYPYNGALPDLGAFETFSPKQARVFGNEVWIDFDLQTNTPIQAKRPEGWNLTNGKKVTGVRSEGPSTLVLTFDGDWCSPETDWSVSYDQTLGDVTDSARIGWRLNQPLHSFSMPVKNECSEPRSIYQCEVAAGSLSLLLVVGWCRRKRR